MLSLLTFVSPIIGLVIILVYMAYYFNKPIPNNIKKLTIPLAICVAQIGYVLPSGASDLASYNSQLWMYKGSLFATFMSDTEKLYLRDWLMNFVGRSGDEKLLPYIVGFVTYGVVFYILFDMVDRNKEFLNNKEVALMTLIAIGIVLPTTAIGNVRNVTAYMLVSFATYRDMMQKKRNILTLFLYIVPIYLHSAAIFLLVIRILQVVIKRLGMWSLSIAIFLPTLINLAFAHINVMPGHLLQTGIQKAYYYLNWTDGGWATVIQNSTSDKISRLYGAFFLLFVLALIIWSVKKRDGFRVIDQPMVSYVFFVAVCALGCLYITTGAFWRFEAVVVMLCPIYLVPIFKMHTRDIRLQIEILTISVVMIFIVNIYLFTKTYNEIPMAGHYLVGNGFVIVRDIIRAVMY